MIDYCPNCGNKDTIEKIDENTLYCPECDQTFEIKKGKATAKPKGRLDTLEERLGRMEDNQRKVNKDLYGNESALPFI